MRKLLAALPLCLLAAAAAPAMTTIAPAGDDSYGPRQGELSLDEMRAATARFRDVNVALAEGYVRDPTDTCHVAADMGQPAALGGMGIHFFRPDLLGITAPPNPRVTGTGTHTDFGRPAILIYEPRADGSLELVAVENLVFQAAWRSAGHAARPTVHGRAWDSMADDPATRTDEAHGFEPHFDQHIWLWRANPRGTYEPFNPTVTCRHHRPRTAAASGHAHHGAGHGGH
ncbi:MAG TPA: hypothetical protein VF552_14300 [Allosphingosinicella sp.]|jgi:hypothetical protein